MRKHRGKVNIGEKYGKLTVQSFSHSGYKGMSYYECLCDCGNTIITRLSSLRSGHTSSCGCIQKEIAKINARKTFWKGGKSDDGSGYVRIYIPEHPLHKTQYVREHRLVAETMLGRYLKPEEIVHHVNGDRADNRPENLVIFASHSEHKKFHQGECHVR